MPELPEVQVVINYLNKNILNKKIINVNVYLMKLFKNITLPEFEKNILNHSFKKIERRGKYLLFYLDNDAIILSHLRMEGKYNYSSTNQIQKHDHIIYEFDDKTYLKYNDTRQFGTIEYYSNQEQAFQSESLNKLGVEPLSDEFDVDYLYNKLKASKKKLKTFLLDQTIIAGIGNIYANEICYSIGLNPETIANKLTKKDANNIVISTKHILSDSIKHNGTTIHSFSFSQWSIGDYQKYLQVHTKKECKKCKSLLKFKKVNGRGTYYCTKCQQLKK